MSEKKATKEKKRRRYGSFAWTDKKSGLLYARIRLPQADGKFKYIYRRAQNIKHAEQLAEEVRSEYEMRGQAFLDGRGMTFKTLAEWYKKGIRNRALLCGRTQDGRNAYLGSGES